MKNVKDKLNRIDELSEKKLLQLARGRISESFRKQGYSSNECTMIASRIIQRIKECNFVDHKSRNMIHKPT